MSDEANTKEEALKRLAYIEGHLKAIRKMVESDAYCVDVLKQTFAVNLAKGAQLKASNTRGKNDAQFGPQLLFDNDRYRRQIEAAYIKMWEIWQCGEPARSFAVAGGHE